MSGVCTGLRGRVTALDATSDPPAGSVEIDGQPRSVSFVFLPDVTVGDLVVVHSGFAIGRLDPTEEARR